MSLQQLARNTLIGLIILAIIYYICYNWFDVPIMYFIYTAFMGSMWVTLSHLLSLVFAPECWLVAGVLSIAYAILHKQSSLDHREALLRFGLTIIATGIVVIILKTAFGRYRPDMLLTDNLYGFHPFSMAKNADSTPSGHATMAFCGFYTIARLLKKSWLTPLLILCAVIIGLAKLILADHYLSDILFGGYLGIICALWMERILHYTYGKWSLSLHGKIK